MEVIMGDYGLGMKVIKMPDLVLLRPSEDVNLQKCIVDSVCPLDVFDSAYLTLAISLLTKNIRLPIGLLVEYIIDIVHYELQTDVIRKDEDTIIYLTQHLHQVVEYLMELGVIKRCEELSCSIAEPTKGYVLSTLVHFQNNINFSYLLLGTENK